MVTRVLHAPIAARGCRTSQRPSIWGGLGLGRRLAPKAPPEGRLSKNGRFEMAKMHFLGLRPTKEVLSAKKEALSAKEGPSAQEGGAFGL